METMTVKEYREKHPSCFYCHHRLCGNFNICDATRKRVSTKTAKKCPCYVPEKWHYEKGGE
jgi:hypothetical protein